MDQQLTDADLKAVKKLINAVRSIPPEWNAEHPNFLEWREQARVIVGRAHWDSSRGDAVVAVPIFQVGEDGTKRKSKTVFRTCVSAIKVLLIGAKTEIGLKLEAGKAKAIPLEHPASIPTAESQRGFTVNLWFSGISIPLGIGIWLGLLSAQGWLAVLLICLGCLLLVAGIVVGARIVERLKMRLLIQVFGIVCAVVGAVLCILFVWSRDRASVVKPEGQIVVSTVSDNKSYEAAAVIFDGRLDEEQKLNSAFSQVMRTQGWVPIKIRRDTKQDNLKLVIRNAGDLPLTNLMVQVRGKYVTTLTGSIKDPVINHLGWKVEPKQNYYPRLDPYKSLDVETSTNLINRTDIDFTAVTVTVEVTADQIKPYLAVFIVGYIKGPWPGSGRYDFTLPGPL